MTNKEAIKELRDVYKEIDDVFIFTGEKKIEALDLAIKALHTVEIIKEELGPAYEEMAIWLDVPHFEEIQERAEKRANKREKEDD